MPNPNGPNGPNDRDKEVRWDVFALIIFALLAIWALVSHWLGGKP